MSQSILLVDKSDGIAMLTMNRPTVMNALSSELFFSLQEAFEDCQKDKNVRVVILTGAGKAFCGGLDLKELASMDGAFDQIPIGEGTHAFFKAINEFDRPIIGAINGATITGGFELALACDILIASPDARFADTHARVGIIPGAGMSQKLPRLIGINRAKELSFTGNFLNADKAEIWGLVNRVVPPAELLPVCIALAEDIASSDLTMIKKYKQLINQGYNGTLSDGIELEMKTHLENAQSGVSGFDSSRREEVQNRGKQQITRRN